MTITLTMAETQKTIDFGDKLSFMLSFLFPERLRYCYMHFHCSYIFTSIIISLQPCALNAEFQHFILRFNKISLLCEYD